MAVGAAEEYELVQAPPPSITSTSKLIQPHDVNCLEEEEDAVELLAYKKKSFRQRWGGRQLTLRSFAVVASLVLLLNVVFVVYTTIRYKTVDAYGTIYRGNCQVASRINFWLHLIINILSTLLLLGSNAFMQAFGAPTRKEIDRAHAKRKWLHIGVLSMRNLKHISFHKGLVCFLFAFSSVPFHLLYNSLVYKTLSTNEYIWAVTTESFLTGAPFNLTQAEFATGVFVTWGSTDTFFQIQKSALSWQNLSATECIDAYSNDISSTWRNVVLVSSDTNDTNSLLLAGSTGWDGLDYSDWNNWICNNLGWGGENSCDTAAQAAQATWILGTHPIKYCLAEETDDVCSVNYSLYIGIIVITFNVIKLICMVYVLFRYNAEHLITTTGDAISTFLMAEDLTTWGMCLVDRPTIRHRFRRLPTGPERYDASRHRCLLWVASRWIWISFTTFLFIALGGILILQAWGSGTLLSRQLPPSEVGFGEPNANAFVFPGGQSFGSAPAMAMLGNSPQVVISIFSIIYNNLLTSMMLARDFSRFAFKPQYLMVSTPAGKQRGTYFLGLPWLQGLFSIALQALLHFFASQSLFPVQVDLVAIDGTIDTENHVSNCGFSPQAIYAAMAAIVVLALNVYIPGLLRLRRGGPPMVSTSSAAISAACHVPSQVPPGMKGERMVYEELRWGASPLDYNGVGHCSIVPAEAWDVGIVGHAIDGALYAGYSDWGKCA